MKPETDLRYDDEVMIPWGNTEVRGRVAEIYGPPAQRRIVVALEPELSSYVVDEPTTVALPIGGIRKVIPLAKPLTLDDESDAVLTYGAHLLGITREAFAAAAIHQLAAAHGVEIEGGASGGGVDSRPPAG